jgi:hypothetical protein
MAIMPYRRGTPLPIREWVVLDVVTYNRPRALHTEAQVWLEAHGFDVINPETAFLSWWTPAWYSYDEVQEIGRTTLFVRALTKVDPGDPYVWAQRDGMPWWDFSGATSTHFEFQSNDGVASNQDTLDALWAEQQVERGIVKVAEGLPLFIKAGIIGAVGIGLYALYKLVPASREGQPWTKNRKSR